MLQAFNEQIELLFKCDGWIDTANQHMTQAGAAHRQLEEHLLYAQQQMDETERKRQESLLHQQEVRDMLPEIQQIIQEAKQL
jgi:hypothetical protein